MKKVFNATIIAKKLIGKKSITPDDGGCQEYIKNELLDYEFSYENINLEDVKNIWLRKGSSKPLVVFAGHTDVVPPEILRNGIQTLLLRRFTIIFCMEGEHLT